MARRSDSFNPRAPSGARPIVFYLPGETPCFNPRAPSGARPPNQPRHLLPNRFQSTRPERGATGGCGAANGRQPVSIHAPRAGRDLTTEDTEPSTTFQSTRPERGATDGIDVDIALVTVSIHAPRAGRDNGLAVREHRSHRFNPRAPSGARHKIAAAFQLPVPVSIHAPRAGRDSRPTSAPSACTFQSTRPERGATPIHRCG